MNPAPYNNHHQPTEDGCKLCGFMRPDFGEDEENTNRISREPPGIAEDSGSRKYDPTFRQHDLRGYKNQARSLNKDLGPGWIEEEIKRLLLETRNPGKFAC